MPPSEPGKHLYLVVVISTAARGSTPYEPLPSLITGKARPLQLHLERTALGLAFVTLLGGVYFLTVASEISIIQHDERGDYFYM